MQVFQACLTIRHAQHLNLVDSSNYHRRTASPRNVVLLILPFLPKCADTTPVQRALAVKYPGKHRVEHGWDCHTMIISAAAGVAA